MRALKEKNYFRGGIPTRKQLENKIFKIKGKKQDILTYRQLNEAISKMLHQPKHNMECFVPVFKFDEDAERFTIIFTSQKMIKRASATIHQDDTTHRYLVVRFNLN